jgi:hypothetical protein
MQFWRVDIQANANEKSISMPNASRLKGIIDHVLHHQELRLLTGHMLFRPGAKAQLQLTVNAIGHNPGIFINQYCLIPITTL